MDDIPEELKNAIKSHLLESQIENAMGWRIHFDERQRKEIAFAQLYARDFHHGTSGHNDMMIIAKMAELLDDKQLQKPI